MSPLVAQSSSITYQVSAAKAKLALAAVVKAKPALFCSRIWLVFGANTADQQPAAEPPTPR